jgi:hypothetical protein
LNAVARSSVSTLRSTPKQCDRAGGSKSTPATARATESTLIGDVAVALTLPRCPRCLLHCCRCCRGRIPRTVWPAIKRPPGRRTGQPPPAINGAPPLGKDRGGGGQGSPLHSSIPSRRPPPPRPRPARPLPLPQPLRLRCCRRRSASASAREVR